MMKKLIVGILTALMLLSLCGFALATETAVKDGEQIGADEFLNGDKQDQTLQELLEEAIGEDISEDFSGNAALEQIIGANGSAPAVYTGEQRVFDYADLLTDEGEAYFEQRIAELRGELGHDIGILTADQGGYDTQDYADTFYEKAGMGMGDDRSGVLFFIDMQNRTTWISTAGQMVRVIYDAREEEIFDAQMDCLAQSDWAGAFDVALDLTEQYVKAGIPAGNYTYDELTGEIIDGPTTELTPAQRRDRTLKGSALGLLGGLGAGFASKSSVKKSYSKKYTPTQYDWRANTRLNLEINTSNLTNKFVTTRIIPRNTDSGGRPGGGGLGSGVHMSSGGMSHGGGGRRF